MSRHICLFVPILFLIGCAQPGLKISQDRLSKSHVFCSSFSEIAYEKLTLNDSKSFKIWFDSPSYDFKSGKSFFKAFELTSNKNPVNVKIKSVFRRDVLFPIITLLDDKFVPVRVIGSPEMAYHPPRWENGYVGGVFEINFNKHEKYMIIHTPKKIVSTTIESKGSDVIPIVTSAGMLFLPGLGSFIHSYSYIGNIQIKTHTSKKKAN